MLDTLESWNEDESIVWRATVQHHNIFGKYSHDQLQLIDNYLPILADYKIDFSLNGHEHNMVYANYPYSQDKFDEEQELLTQTTHAIECQFDMEMHFNDMSTYQEYTQGEYLHQITSGASGKELLEICANMPSAGRFKYAQNKYPGWT